jgi:hypothetical protein
MTRSIGRREKRSETKNASSPPRHDIIIIYTSRSAHTLLTALRSFSFLYFLSTFSIIVSLGGGGGGGTSKSWTPGPSSGTALAGSQLVQLTQIRYRDAEFVTELDEIGEGIQDLRELALRQGEEVRRQNVMLNNTQSRLDDAHKHMTNVNAKLKETLNEVGRSSDKLCVDIMCIVSCVSLVALFVRTGGVGSH